MVADRIRAAQRAIRRIGLWLGPLASARTQHSHALMISRGLCDIVEEIANQLILAKGDIKCPPARKLNQFLQLANICRVRISPLQTHK